MLVRFHPRHSRPGRCHSRLRSRLTVEPLERRFLLSACSLLPHPTQLVVTTRSGEVETVRVDNAAAVGSMLAAYRANPNVATAEIDQRVFASVLPNDSQFGSLYAMQNTGQSGGTVDADIDADQAWDLHTGSLGTTVAIIDTGIDYTHPDLYKNIWLNQGELPTGLGLMHTDGDGLITFWDLNEAANAGKVTDANANGRIDGYDVLHDTRWANRQDNDGNGKIDDLIGWDFANDDNDPLDDNNHGTHVAGTIGGMGNNALGVAGVNWKVSLVGLKFMDGSGSGYTSDAVDALKYAVSKGIKISNNSWGGGGYSSALANAINSGRSAGHIFVAAAGNAAANNDTKPSYPANYNYNNVVAVAATDRFDRLSSFSNYGASTVDLAAPGSSILSTVVGGGYAAFSGTSMATPLVSGSVALVWSANPSLSYSQVISRILSGVDSVSALAGKVATGGRLNVYRALGGASAPADTTGPRVTAASINGTTSVSGIRVTFSEAVNPTTFTTADVVGSGPLGTIAVTGVAAVGGTNNTQFDITFAAQTTPGAYGFNIGPSILDTAGNLMDQDGDGTRGETTDFYRAAFSIAASTTATFTVSPGAPVTDYVTTASTVTIDQDLSIADLNVKLNISHTYDGDLYAYLRGPDGTLVDLVKYRGGSGDNFTNTTLDDEVATLVRNGTAPFSSSYKPEQVLSAFDGKNAKGTWTLFVYDGGRYDGGKLNSWSLVITPGGAGAAAVRSLPADAVRALDAVFARGFAARIPAAVPNQMLHDLARMYASTGPAAARASAESLKAMASSGSGTTGARPQPCAAHGDAGSLGSVGHRPNRSVAAGASGLLGGDSQGW